MSRSNQGEAPYQPPTPGTIETEFGVPIPGVVLAPEQWASTALKKLPQSQPLRFHELFGREAPVALDIGCGNGRFILASAARRPEWNHIGIDILPLVIRYATRRANQRGFHHCRFAACDGWRFLNEYCLDSSLDEVHVYHPQPFSNPNEKHLRLLNPDFLGLLYRKLCPQGKLFVQTDNVAYWRYLSEVLPQALHWHPQIGPWPDDPHGRSRREMISIEKGLSIFRGWGHLRSELAPAEVQALLDRLPPPDFDIADRKRGHRRRRQPRR